MTKVLIANQFNSDNLGDKLLNDCLIMQLQKVGIYSDNAGFAQIAKQEVIYATKRGRIATIVSFVKRHLPAGIKYYLGYKHRLNKVFNQINSNEYSAIIVGGGQLLKHDSVFMYCLAAWVEYARRSNTPIYLFGIGIDYGMTFKEILFYKKIISDIDFINVRDHESQNLFQEYFCRKVDISADIAFSYEFKDKGYKRDSIVVMPYNYKTAQKSFGMKITKERYYKELRTQIQELVDNQLISTVFITATTSADAQESILFANYLMKTGLQVSIQQIQTYDELISLLQRATCIISGRMHAMIMGLICGCRIYPIEVSNKIREFKNEYLKDEFDIHQTIMSIEYGINVLSKKISER